MKGIVFTEFLEMVEEKFGLAMADQIIENSELPSSGIYTAIGTYDFNEMVQLLTNLSKETGLGPDVLLHTFGLYLFDSLGNAHPEVVENYKDPLSLIYCIEDHIHIHVRKLYPDAQLPTFTILEKTENSLSMIYASERGLYTLAKGLIERAFQHFDKSATVNYELLESDGTRVKFDIFENG